MKKLPVGIQTFRTIREDNYLYVDKTGIIFDMVNTGAYYFLARPRRFGKSLLVSTLQALFEGRRTLFQGLAVHDQWDWQTKYPVIKLSFAGASPTVEEVDSAFFSMLQTNQKRLRITCEETADIGRCFRELIEKCYEKYGEKVVVLIDEYDKLILDNIDTPERVQQVREGLDRFYTVLKDSDEYLKFVFVTGLMKLADCSLFSGLNNLEDISFSKQYATLCGYSQYDLDTIFFSLLQKVDKEKLQNWYGGYNFLGETLYNPYSILLFLKNDAVFDNYWFKATPPAVLDTITLAQDHYLDMLEKVTVNSDVLGSFDTARPGIESVLYHCGYLSIQKTSRAGAATLHTLSYPNLECRHSLNEFYISRLSGSMSEKAGFQQELFTALDTGNMDGLRRVLGNLFAAVSCKEQNCFRGVLYAYLASLGLSLGVETGHDRVRCCITVFLKKNSYLLDFAVDSSGSSLQEIKENNGLQQSIAEGRNIHLVRVVLSSKEKRLTQFEYKQIS